MTSPKEQDWEKEFDARFKRSQFIRYPEIKSFVANLLSSQRSALKEKIVQQGKDMKETHICGFNDGEQTCECYQAALSDVLNLINE